MPFNSIHAKLPHRTLLLGVTGDQNSPTLYQGMHMNVGYVQGVNVHTCTVYIHTDKTLAQKFDQNSNQVSEVIKLPFLNKTQSVGSQVKEDPLYLII